MKYILDSNVALKTVLPEQDSPHANRLIGDFNNGLHELLAPDVFPIEIGHALTRAERQRRIAPPDGWRFWQSLMTDAPEFQPSLPLMRRAFELSLKMRIGLYDCLYVALAEEQGCELVTGDGRLIQVLSGFPIVSVSAL